MARKQLAAASAILKRQAPPPPRHPSKALTYVPMQREAGQRQADIKTKSFQMTGDYTQYGSSDGGWRLVPVGRRFVLPNGCAPRRSRRING